MNIDFNIVFTIVALYFGGILGSILWPRFKATGSIMPGVEEFFVAKKSLPTAVLILTYIGSLFSAFTVVGLPGSVYTHGIAGMLWVTIGIFIACLLMYYLAPKMRQYAEKNHLISPIGLLRHAYASVPLGVLSTLMLVVFLSPYLSLQLVGLGKLLEVVSGGEITYITGVGTTLAIVLVYVLFGGMRAVAYTDVVQSIMIFAGMFLGVYMLVSHYWGGFYELFEAVKQVSPAHLSLPGAKGFYTDTMFFSYVIFAMGFLFLPHLLTRFMMAKDDKQVKQVVVATGLVALIAYIPGLIFGLIAVVLHPGLEQSNAVGGLVFADLSALGTLGGIAAMMLLIGVLGASMSTADSILLSISQLVTRDIIRPFWEPSDKMQVILARIIMASLLALAFWIGMNPPALMIDLAIYAAKGAGLFMPLYFGMWWSKRNAHAAMLAISVGAFILLYLGLNGIKPYGFDGVIFAWLATFIIFVGGSYIFPAKNKGQAI